MSTQSLRTRALQLDGMPDHTYQASVWRVPAEISVPCGHVLVRQARRDVEHDDGTLAMNVVAVTKAAKLFLARRVPTVEPDLATVGGEVQRMDFNTDGGCTQSESSLCIRNASEMLQSYLQPAMALLMRRQ